MHGVLREDNAGEVGDLRGSGILKFLVRVFILDPALVGDVSKVEGKTKVPGIGDGNSSVAGNTSCRHPVCSVN